MKEKDGEIRIGESRYYFGEDNIIYVTEVGEIDDQKVMAIKEVFPEFLAVANGKVNILVDLNKAKKPSTKARKLFMEITEHKSVHKIAHFGMHPVARVLASFIMGVSQKKEMCFFKTKEEALKWLKN
jgi:hypothetical protein